MEQNKCPVGMHIRLTDGLEDVVKKVDELEISIVQSFLLKESGGYLTLSDKSIRDFVHAKKQRKFLYYLHAAYWSNVTDISSKGFYALQRETSIGLDLQMDGIVIHIGATKDGASKKDRVSIVAEGVNTVLEKHPQAKLLLENSPHSGRNFGGDLEELASIIDHVENKAQLSFCIDTAHAHVYGYDLKKEKNQEDFIQLLRNTIGIDKIALLHVNDSADHCGSCIDKHAVPGKGDIGHSAMKRFVGHDLFKNIPIIIEPHKLTSDEEISVIKEVSSWR